MSVVDTYEHLWVPEPNTGCWLWYGSAVKNYGRVKIDKKMKLVSRLICEELFGPPPTSDHQAAHATPNGCVGGACINPDHLRWASRGENQLDMPLEARIKRSRKAGLAANASFTRDRLSERGRKGGLASAISLTPEEKKARSLKMHAARYG